MCRAPIKIYPVGNGRLVSMCEQEYVGYGWLVVMRIRGEANHTEKGMLGKAISRRIHHVFDFRPHKIWMPLKSFTQEFGLYFFELVFGYIRFFFSMLPNASEWEKWNTHCCETPVIIIMQSICSSIDSGLCATLEVLKILAFLDLESKTINPICLIL